MVGYFRMTVKEIALNQGFRIMTRDLAALEKEVTGVYACDLLSNAMAKLNKGDVWITVHTNLNVVAVASLSEASCVLIPEAIEIEEQTIERADLKNVAILSSPKSASEISFNLLSLKRE